MATCEQIISSEGVYDFNCTPCTQRERFSEAKKFCVECGEYFCSTCLSCHEHFGATKGHTLIDCQDVSTEHAVTRLAKCKIHVNKEEDMVCGEHDVVCCRVCIATNHRSCQDIDYLPEAAQSFREGEKRAEVDKDVKNKIGELRRSYKEHVTHSVQLKMRKKTLLKRLELFKVSTTELIENLVTKAKTDIENTYEPAVSVTQKHIQSTGKQLSVINILSEELAKESSPIMVYRKALECKRNLKETQITQLSSENGIVVMDEALLGIAETVQMSVKNGRFFGAFNFEEQGIEIPNMCMLPDGSFCLAHYFKKKIIRIDTSLVESDTFVAERKVWGVCATNQSEIAFTMPALKKVQFLVFGRDKMLKSSFCTKIHCRGIAYCNENIYLAGGGFPGEESGEVNVFDLKGRLLQRFEQYSDAQYINVPRSVIANTKHIYVTDCQNGVICLDLHGERRWTHRSSKCEYPWGICFTPNANILITGHKSNNILVLSEDGELLGDLLDENDGISAPKAVSIDIPNNRLLVTTSKGSILKVFEFEDFEI